MCKKIVLFLITLCCFTIAAYSAESRFTLVIDPGHGGHDAGAIGRVAKEKDLTLRYALAFGRMVERNCPDVKVVYTRKTDRFVELYRRAEIANQNKADLFVSIHINALPRGRVARGFQTYTLGTSKRTGKKTGVEANLEVAKRENSVIFLEKDYKQTYQGYDPNSPESNIMFEFIQDKNMENSVELAKYMQRYVCQATGRENMGAQQDNLAVLRLSSMAGCLVECGFISTRDEENFMNSKAAAEQYARGFYNAFMAYRKSHGGNTSISYQPAVVSDTKPEPVAEKKNVKETRKERKERERLEKARQEELRKQEEMRDRELAERQAQDPQTMFKVQPQPKVQPQTSQNASQTPKNASQDSPNSSQAVQDGSQTTQVASQNPQRAPQTVQSQTPDKSQPSDGIDSSKGVVNQVLKPVFKVQIFTSSTLLKSNDKRFKGLKDTGYYQEGGIYKYTVGASENYNEMLRFRREVAKVFPNAFIIAFKNGERMDVNDAIKEFKSNKSR